MARSGRFYSSDGMVWFAGPRHAIDLAVKIFMMVKDCCVMKKLSGEPMPFYANGLEMQKAINPEWKGFAFYWLRQEYIEETLKLLIKNELLDKKMRGRAPYGYGDDEQYWLTNRAGQIITDQKTNKDIEAEVCRILEENYQKSYDTID